MLPFRIPRELMKAGWLMALWPSTKIISGFSLLNAWTTEFSTSPTTNWEISASVETPYFAPCIKLVCPVATSTDFNPRLFRVLLSSTAEVIFPQAQSVPNTAITGTFTSEIWPVKRCKSFKGGGFLMSLIIISFSVATWANSASSEKNWCRPLMMSIPFSMASRIISLSLLGI